MDRSLSYHGSELAVIEEKCQNSMLPHMDATCAKRFLARAFPKIIPRNLFILPQQWVTKPV